MRRHFFRIGRHLVGKARAKGLRDDPAWFDSADLSSPLEETSAATEGWDECIELLDSSWRPLAEALRSEGVPAPFEVDWEIPVEGRVSGVRALMVWEILGGFAGLVDSETEPPDDGRWLGARADSDPQEIVNTLRDWGIGS